jgi:putative membrane protein
MIQYNPKDWFTFIFRFHKSDTMRVLSKLILSLGLYSLFICILEKEVLKLSDTSVVKNIGIMHTLLGMVISLLLVFRTNTAYDRWWEGRKLWGTLVNNSRNIAIKLETYLPSDAKEDRAYFNRAIPAYANILRNHLSNPALSNELFDVEGYSNLFPNLNMEMHLPNQVATQMMKHLERARKVNFLSDMQLLLLNEEMKGFTDICGACERIKNTPIPFSYSTFLKKFIFFYVMTLPFGLVFTLSYYTIPITLFIFYVLASLELIAEEIEDPFGEDSNDLPMDRLAKNIRKHVDEIFNHSPDLK